MTEPLSAGVWSIEVGVCSGGFHWPPEQTRYYRIWAADAVTAELIACQIASGSAFPVCSRVLGFLW